MASRMRLSGSFVALVTPFTDGEVDYETLAGLIEFQIESGTQGLVPCGTTGESPTLSHAEQGRVTSFVVERAAGRVPVVAGTGSNATAEALQMTKCAKECGADACLVVNPYYNKPTQQGMYEHIARIAEVDLPIVLYNIPGRTAVELTAETIVRMYEDIEQVIAVKEATGKLDIASAVAAACDIVILSGDDSLTLPICSVGGSGVVSVLANILPREIRKLCDDIDAGDSEAARMQHLRLFPAFKAMFLETNPIPIKAALAMAGMISEEFRLPMTPLSDCHRGSLAKLLADFGVNIIA
jgi:4-hydroxy-tetrahydrodipicolinate synthase